MLASLSDDLEETVKDGSHSLGVGLLREMLECLFCITCMHASTFRDVGHHQEPQPQDQSPRQGKPPAVLCLQPSNACMQVLKESIKAASRAPNDAHARALVRTATTDLELLNKGLLDQVAGLHRYTCGVHVPFDAPCTCSW